MKSSKSAMLLLAWTTLNGCREVAAPRPNCRSSAEVVITTVSDTNGLRAIDPATGRTCARLDLEGSIEGTAALLGGATVYAAIVGSGFRRDLVAVDTRSMAVQWRLPLSQNGRPQITDGVGLLTGEVLAVLPNGNRLYVWRAIKDGVVGIAALDLHTRRPLAFSGPWNVAAGGLVPLPPSPALPGGALAVLASRENASGGPRRQAAVYLLDPISLAPGDSILPAALYGAANQDIWQVVPAPDGRSLYMAGSKQLVRYDLAERRVTASTLRPSTGMLAITPDGSMLVVTDAGAWPDSPGSGLLSLYGPNFEPRGAVDVSTPLGGRPHSPTATVTRLPVVGPSGQTLYVPSGTPPIGPLYPTQPARLLVVDVVDRTLRKAIELGGYGLGFVFVREG